MGVARLRAKETVAGRGLTGNGICQDPGKRGVELGHGGGIGAVHRFEKGVQPTFSVAEISGSWRNRGT